MATQNNSAWAKGTQPLIMEFCTSVYSPDMLRLALRYGPNNDEAIGYEAEIGTRFGTDSTYERAKQTVAALREAADKFEAILELEKD